MTKHYKRFKFTYQSISMDYKDTYNSSITFDALDEMDARVKWVEWKYATVNKTWEAITLIDVKEVPSDCGEGEGQDPSECLKKLVENLR